MDYDWDYYLEGLMKDINQVRTSMSYKAVNSCLLKVTFHFQIFKFQNIKL